MGYRKTVISIIPMSRGCYAKSMRITQIKPDIARKLEKIYCLDLPTIGKDGVRNRATVQRVIRVFAVRSVLESLQKKSPQTFDELQKETQVFPRLLKEIALLLVHRQQVELELADGNYVFYLVQ